MSESDCFIREDFSSLSFGVSSVFGPVLGFLLVPGVFFSVLFVFVGVSTSFSWDFLTSLGDESTSKSDNIHQGDCLNNIISQVFLLGTDLLGSSFS